MEKRNEDVSVSVAEKDAISSLDCNSQRIGCLEISSSDTADRADQNNGRRVRKRVIAAPAKEEKTQRKRPKSSNNDDMSWICTECKEAEALDDKNAVLVICEGPCNRPFHTTCVGLEREHVNEESWVCSDCKMSRHLCSICQEYGQDTIDVFKCQLSSCGLFFHESCLSTYNVDVKIGNNERPENQSNGENSGEVCMPDSTPLFKCPAHQCWTCTEEMATEEEEKTSATQKGKKGKGKKRKTKKDNIFGTKTGRLIRCLECPIAYHISCIPPNARFHELALLCHDHASTCRLPTLDLDASFQGQLEQAADNLVEKLAKSKRSNSRNIKMKQDKKNIFFHSLRGDSITIEEDHLLSHLDECSGKEKEQTPFPIQFREVMFCLPCDVKDEVYAKPPSFKFVHSLRYSALKRPKRKPPSEEVCQCKSAGVETCGENCHNKMMFIECTGKQSKENGAKNSYWNCALGPSCGNRSMGLRQTAKCKPQREQGKGWGLITLVPLKKGDLVQEYVGEVIDENKKEQRLKDWSKDHPNDPNFYVMQLEAGWYIDARVEANLSRFVNHSCDPNCILRPVTVSGYTRIGIFAEKNIAPGEFLSYDYRFDTRHGDRFICRCGAANCRGTMKGGKNLIEKEQEKKTQKQALAEAKSQEDKDRKFLAEVQRLKDNNFSQVDFMIPDFQYPNETIAGGPYNRYKSEGRANRVFLWRNILIGSQFSNRAYLLKKKSKSKICKTVQKPVDVLSHLNMLMKQDRGKPAENSI
mmetsp:Transcript_32718/g.48443  ORF Transcript_32718/g.48443 Transcript_32718/m.48443 type:complete len:754 (+) Transcript_32718:161-2422(+)|eukprot:CAMPEP_0194256624 /NCGR_PEP_ID=MMETSP0158-20130606/37095_1 /TAXON_ID=33649 /ORGANISM="Thalassionema nitzschioides, Strain L26-B" /LENGTH=753 /DNA_ID=CAMNT_0038995367 /DNA_START=80 /DNA_END=2341 /DNA_ORIENTATION=+